MHLGSSRREPLRGELKGKGEGGHVSLGLPIRSLVSILQAVEPLLGHRGGLQADLHFRNLILAIWMTNMGTEKADQGRSYWDDSHERQETEPEQWLSEQRGVNAFDIVKGWLDFIVHLDDLDNLSSILWVNQCFAVRIRDLTLW